MKKTFLAFIIVANLSGLSRAFSQKLQEVTIVNWNLQCFFDSVTEGTEYTEFIKSKSWSRAAYEERLNKLCDCIKKIKADIYVFEEVENHGVVMDISNRLCDYSFNKKKNWNYAAFAKNPGESIGCAVLSRLPIEDFTVHALDIRTESEKQPSMRPIMKVKVLCEGELIILVNHWKSKSGGEEKSEVWRNWQELHLSNLFTECLEECANVIACGDFNRDVGEFSITGECTARGERLFSLGSSTETSGTTTALTISSALSKTTASTTTGIEDFNFKVAKVKNPWIKSNGKLVEPGSYYYKGEFERIDSFFIAPELFVSEFTPLLGPWCSDDGIPNKFQISSGQGYSDHLPVSCTLQL